MQKSSHMRLAHALLKKAGGFSAKRYERAFLFGSIQPDCNPFSYLKGSIRAKTFGGHTYANNRAFIEKRIRRLRNKEHWTIWTYYTLGKLSHYLADAFTLPHNDHFPGRGWAHRVYESELRKHVADYLFTEEPQNREALDDLPGEIFKLHQQYIAEENPGYETDIKYILHANEMLMACCQPAPAMAPEAALDMLTGELLGNAGELLNGVSGEFLGSAGELLNGMGEELLGGVSGDLLNGDLSPAPSHVHA